MLAMCQTLVPEVLAFHSLFSPNLSIRRSSAFLRQRGAQRVETQETYGDRSTLSLVPRLLGRCRARHEFLPEVCDIPELLAGQQGVGSLLAVNHTCPNRLMPVKISCFLPRRKEAQSPPWGGQS